MKYFKALAIVPALAVALTGLLTANASAEWYKQFGDQAYTTKDTDRGGQEQFAQSGTVTTDALNADQEKHRGYRQREHDRQKEHEIIKNLR